MQVPPDLLQLDNPQVRNSEELYVGDTLLLGKAGLVLPGDATSSRRRCSSSCLRVVRRRMRWSTTIPARAATGAMTATARVSQIGATTGTVGRGVAGCAMTVLEPYPCQRRGPEARVRRSPEEMLVQA